MIRSPAAVIVPGAARLRGHLLGRTEGERGKVTRAGASHLGFAGIGHGHNQVLRLEDLQRRESSQSALLHCAPCALCSHEAMEPRIEQFSR